MSGHTQGRTFTKLVPSPVDSLSVETVFRTLPQFPWAVRVKVVPGEPYLLSRKLRVGKYTVSRISLYGMGGISDL